MKTRFRKRRGSQEVKVDKETEKASGSSLDGIAFKEDVNSQDESIVVEGKATSEPSEQQVRNNVQGSEEVEMPNVTGEEQNLNVTKELQKRKRTADVEIAIVSPTDKCSSRLRPRKEVPSFQMVDLNENDVERIVGMRVKVYWPDSKKWFSGRIKSFNREKMLHIVNYDDGDVEELDLKKEKFELEVKPKDGFHIKAELHSRKSKKDLSGHVVGKTSFSQEYVKAKDNAHIEGENNSEIEGERKEDLGGDVVSNTSFSQEYDKVKHNSKIEGEGPKTAVSKEDMESNPGEQQPADNKSERDENQVGSARLNARFTDVDGSRRH